MMLFRKSPFVGPGSGAKSSNKTQQAMLHPSRTLLRKQVSRSRYGQLGAPSYMEPSSYHGRAQMRAGQLMTVEGRDVEQARTDHHIRSGKTERAIPHPGADGFVQRDVPPVQLLAYTRNADATTLEVLPDLSESDLSLCHAGNYCRSWSGCTPPCRA